MSDKPQVVSEGHTGLKDGRGNSINVGDEVLLTSSPSAVLGKVVAFNRGGVLLTADHKAGPVGQTPAQIRVLVDLTISVQPGTNVLGGIYRIVNPESEEIVKKLTDQLTQ